MRNCQAIAVSKQSSGQAGYERFTCIKRSVWLHLVICLVDFAGYRFTGISDVFCFPWHDVESDQRGAFTWFCVAQLLMGFARSFIVVLGVTFAVEAENESEIFVYIGKVAQITSQLASKGTKNQERL